jgi:hypothetical protein
MSLSWTTALNYALLFIATGGTIENFPKSMYPPEKTAPKRALLFIVPGRKTPEGGSTPPASLQQSKIPLKTLWVVQLNAVFWY